MRKIAYMIIMLMLVAGLSTGCNKSNKKPSDVSINVCIYYEDDQAEIYKKIAKAYMDANPGSTVKVETGYSDKNALSQALSSDGGIDIIGLKRSQLIEYAKSGYLYDMSSMSQEMDYKGSLYPICLSYGTYDGIVYGIGDMPMSLEWFYNKDIFDKYNLQEPSSISQLEAVCEKLSNKGIIPISIGGMEGWNINMLLGAITSQTEGAASLTSCYGSDAKAFSSRQGMYQGFEILGNLIDNCFDEEFGRINYVQSVNDFVNGDAAILPALSQTQDLIDDLKPKDFDYGVFSSPVKFISSPKSDYCASAAQVLSIPNNSANKEEAAKFIKYVFSSEGQKYFADKGYVASLKTVNTSNEEVKKSVYTHLSNTNDDSIMLYDNISPEMLKNTNAILSNIADEIVKSDDAWDKIINLTFSE